MGAHHSADHGKEVALASMSPWHGYQQNARGVTHCLTSFRSVPHSDAANGLTH
jgi:hypothetical protein